MKSLILITIILLMMPLAYSYSLNDYPDMFISDSKINAKIVVGDLAIASDTIGAIDIATSLQVNPTTNQTYSSISAVLASEIDDIKAHNLISVGGPCANSITAELMGYPAVCYDSIESNTALIKLYEFENSISLIVAGRSAMDTRRAARVLADYYDYVLPVSDSMTVINTVETQITVN